MRWRLAARGFRSPAKTDSTVAATKANLTKGLRRFKRTYGAIYVQASIRIEAKVVEETTAKAEKYRSLKMRHSLVVNQSLKLCHSIKKGWTAYKQDESETEELRFFSVVITGESEKMDVKRSAPK